MATSSCAIRAAILVYLASKYGDENVAAAGPRRGMAQGRRSGSPSPPTRSATASTVARFAASSFGGAGIDLADRAAARRAYALKILDAHGLTGATWLALDRPTIADIACYPYIGLAGEGEVSIEKHANVRAWIKRVEALPGYVPMPGLPCPVA